MPSNNDSGKKSSRSLLIIRIVVGSLCILFFLSIITSGDLGVLFNVTSERWWLDSIPVFLILILVIAAFIFPFGNSSDSKKEKNDH